MKLVRLDISGFRGVRSGKILFSDFTVLIGANNCGKTTIIEAIALLFGRDRLVRNLTEHDFFGSDPQPADRIQIIATVAGFAANDPEHHHDWFRAGRATEKWFNPISGELSAVQTDQASQLACQIAFCARFDRLALEAEAVRYFYDGEEAADPFAEESTAVAVPTALIKDIGMFLVPASRTWDRMISFGSELFRRTVAYVGGNPSEAVLAERDRLRHPGQPLEADAQLAGLVGDIDDDLRKLFGREIALSLRLTSTDSEGVLDAVMPHFAEQDRPALPGRRHGNGLISLQTLVLLMRFGNLRKTRGDNFIMLIEEPELHVPPPQQRKLLHYLKRMATQTVVTSHSPIAAAVADPHQLVLVVNRSGEVAAKPLLPTPINAAADAVRRALFLSDRNATVSAVMHPAVLIPEGKTDASWLRLFGRIADLTEPPDATENATFTHEVGVIPTKDARIMDTYRDLVNVHPALTCLVDGDQAGTDYRNHLSVANPVCRRIIQWQAGWTMEDVVAWVCAADPSILEAPDLAGQGAPVNIGEFSGFLKNKPPKTDEVLHAAIADAITTKPLCSRRVRHVLAVLAAIATDRDPPADSVTDHPHQNGITHTWTFNDDVQGL